jgi:hypothetical protein
MNKPQYEDVFQRAEDITGDSNELDAFLLALEVTQTLYEMYDSYDDMQVPEEERPDACPFPAWDAVLVFGRKEQTDHQFFFADGKYLGSAKLVWR